MAGGKMYNYTKRTKKKRGAAPKKQKGYTMTKYVPRNRISTNSDYTSFFRCEPIEFSNDSTITVRDGLSFQLTDIINFSSFTTIWDQYRIDQVIVKFIPVLTTVVNRPFDDSTNPGASVGEIPRLTTMIDRDDRAVPLDFNQIFQRPQSRTKMATKAIIWKFTPNRLVEVYRSTTSTAYKIDTNKKQFLDCGYSNVPHYGLKFALEATSPSNCYQYRIERSFKISFKNRRL